MKFRYLLIILFAMLIAPAGHAGGDSNATSGSWLRQHYGGNVTLNNCFYWENFMNTSSGQSSITTTHGVHITDHVFVGVGTGFVFFYGHDWIGAHIPVFADARYTFTTGRWRPFADFRLGYAYGSECGLAEPSVGIKYAFKRKLGLSLSLGTTTYFAGYIDNGIWCNGLNVSLGIDF